MTQIRLWVVVCALVCVCSVASQKTEIQFINNCFNVDGGVLFCLKTGVQSCDSKWFYQILTPPDELGTSFVLDTQIVLSGESSTQCYPVSHHENQCQYCVGFIDSEVGSDGSLRVALHVDLYCGDSTVSYPHNIMRVQGQRCGVPEYYYLPCDAQDNCILVGEGENPALFCPTVLVDTCATSYVGLVATIDGFSTVVSTGNVDPICTELSVGSLCVTADILMITDEVADNFQTVTTNVQACIRNDSDEGSPCEITDVVVTARYPRCGFSLEDGCQIVEHVYPNDPVFTQSVHDQNSGDHHNNHPVIIDYANSDSEVDVEVYEDSGSNLYLALILVAVISAVGLCFVLSAVGIYLVVRSRKNSASQYELVSYY